MAVGRVMISPTAIAGRALAEHWPLAGWVWAAHTREVSAANIGHVHTIVKTFWVVRFDPSLL